MSGESDVQRLHRLLQVPVLNCVDLGERGLVGDGRERVLERVEKREVACACERGEETTPRRPARAVECPHELASFRRVTAESAHLGVQVLDQDVEVAHGSERTAQPAQLGAERPGRLLVEEIAACAQKCPQPPGRDAELMQLLGVGAEPRSGIVREQLLRLLAEAGAQHGRGRGAVAALRRLGLELEIESLEDLGPGLTVGCPGSAQGLLEAPQRLLVAVEQLHLELLEAARNTLVIEHRDGVVHDLGAVCPHALAMGAETGDRQQRHAAEMTGE